MTQYTSCGKQVLFDRQHVADVATEGEASQIAKALNAPPAGFLNVLLWRWRDAAYRRAVKAERGARAALYEARADRDRHRRNAEFFRDDRDHWKAIALDRTAYMRKPVQ